MSETIHNQWYENPERMERRIFYGMCAVVVLAVTVSAPFAAWRTTSGLLLGGCLSLMNYRWLRASIGSALSADGSGGKFGVARYALRYLIVAAAIAASQLLDVASLIATLVGLCAFVVAALFEAFMQTYFAIKGREEN